MSKLLLVRRGIVNLPAHLGLAWPGLENKMSGLLLVRFGIVNLPAHLGLA
ncbi:hypothetical protein ACFLU4_07485 [Chloroflexota bacterium]